MMAKRGIESEPMRLATCSIITVIAVWQRGAFLQYAGPATVQLTTHGAVVLCLVATGLLQSATKTIV